MASIGQESGTIADMLQKASSFSLEFDAVSEAEKYILSASGQKSLIGRLNNSSTNFEKMQWIFRYTGNFLEGNNIPRQEILSLLGQVRDCPNGEEMDYNSLMDNNPALKSLRTDQIGELIELVDLFLEVRFEPQEAFHVSDGCMENIGAELGNIAEMIERINNNGCNSNRYRREPIQEKSIQDDSPQEQLIQRDSKFLSFLSGSYNNISSRIHGYKERAVSGLKRIRSRLSGLFYGESIDDAFKGTNEESKTLPSDVLKYAGQKKPLLEVSGINRNPEILNYVRKKAVCQDYNALKEHGIMREAYIENMVQNNKGPNKQSLERAKRIELILSTAFKDTGEAKFSARELAEGLGVSKSTIYRDLKSINEILGINSNNDYQQLRYSPVSFTKKYAV